MESKLARHVEMTLDEHAYDHYEKPVAKANAAPDPDIIEQLPLHGVEKLDFGYTTMKEYVEKSKKILSGDNLSCAACTGPIRKNHDLVLVCEHTSCHGVTHIGCLSRHFMQSEPGGSRYLLPINGKCPKCKKLSRWQTLVKELSLRTRGEKELAQIFKKPRVRKNAGGASAVGPEEETMTMEEQEESDEDGFVDLEEFEKSVLEEVPEQVGDDGFVDLDEFEAKAKRAVKGRSRSRSPLRGKG
jgi:structure-specific endonuclease subunit SLX1